VKNSHARSHVAHETPHSPVAVFSLERYGHAHCNGKAAAYYRAREKRNALVENVHALSLKNLLFEPSRVAAGQQVMIVGTVGRKNPVARLHLLEEFYELQFVIARKVDWSKYFFRFKMPGYFRFEIPKLLFIHHA